MTALLTQNAKMRKSGGDKYALFNFGIPAYKSTTGLMTCPMAGKCAQGCYAQSGAYTWSNVSQAFEARLALSHTDDFVPKVSAAIATKHKSALRKNKQLVIRIHDSGDFYNITYANKWLQIIAQHPDVKFYAYTKMVPMFQRLAAQSKIPSNFTVIYSEGGIADDRIRDDDRHSRVFPTLQALIDAGYDDASNDDKVAFLSASGKVGLVYHGSKVNSWNTN